MATLTGIYYGQVDTDSLFIFAEEAIRVARQHKQYNNLFFAHQQLIRRYLRNEQIITALRYAEEVREEAGGLQQNLPEAMILASIGNIYYRLGQYEEAVRYTVESTEKALQSRDPNSTIYAANYDFLSAMGRYMNRWQDMLRYADSMYVEIDRLQQLAPDEGDMNLYFYRAYSARATAYAGMKQPEAALREIRNAEAIYDLRWNEVNRYNAIELDDMYGAYYHAAGDYKRAIEHLDRVLEYFEDTGNLSQVILTNNRRAAAFYEMGDLRNAIETHNQIRQQTDSLNRQKFYAQINEFRTIYELDKTEMETERRQAAIQRQRTLIAALSVVCLALALVVVLVILNRRRIAEKNRALYRQIKEQDRIAETLAKAKTQYAPLPKDEKESDQQDFIMRLREHVLSDRYSANPEADIDKIIKALNTNRTYLYKTVKNATGQTVQDYLNTIRLDEARRLLDTTGELIETVAWMSGFNSIRTFYRVFRERYNMTPNDYRKSKR